METSGFDTENWGISGTSVGDQKNLVWDFWSVTEFWSESVVDNPSDGESSVGSPTFVFNSVDGVNSLLMVCHFVHVESELWFSVVCDETDPDTSLTQVRLEKKVDDEVLHLVEVVVTNGGRLIQDDEKVQFVVWIFGVALSFAAWGLLDDLSPEIVP